MTSRIAKLVPVLQHTDSAVLGQVSKPDTSVIAAGYPMLFPTKDYGYTALFKGQSCLLLRPLLTPADQSFLNKAARQLDGVVKQAANQAGVNFIDPRAVFGGHGVCGNKGAWIHGLSIASGTGGSQSCTFMLFGRCRIGALPIIGSFHPNRYGQADGYATDFESFINNDPSRTPDGFPTNPSPFTPQLATSATQPAPQVQIDTLTLTPTTAGPDSCEGTLAAGASVGVSGQGFAPGASVGIYVTSPGLGSSGEVSLGNVVAGPTGAIQDTISVPSGATGFVQAGASAGLIFFNAIGAGQSTPHEDNVAMAGFAPAGSACATSVPPSTGLLGPSGLGGLLGPSGLGGLLGSGGQ
ncbi:MAG: hypothetical protein ACRDWV_03680 [Acidimicrobiales bacterium]